MNKTSVPETPASKAQDQKRSDALRKNLLKRKQQSRARRAPEEGAPNLNQAPSRREKK